PKMMPVNQELLRYLEQQSEVGRDLWLVSASPEPWVARLSEHFDIFQRHAGSTPEKNLKAERKADFLSQHLGSAFCYAGDSHADRAVWKVSESAILVGDAARFADSVPCRVEAVIPGRKPLMTSALRSMRMHQWVKNLLLLVPLALAGEIFRIPELLLVLSAVLALSLLCSGTYLINDLADRRADRLHPFKSGRAVASGNLPLPWALGLALVLIFVGLSAGLALDPRLGLIMGIYLVITLSYSFRLKRLAVVDLFVLATLYTLRIVMGLVLLDHAFSSWLLIFSFAMFSSLAAIKRVAEIKLGGQTGKSSGRGYIHDDVALLRSLGLSLSVAAVLFLVLYMEYEVFTREVFESPQWLWLAPPCVLAWVCRMWLVADRGSMHSDPVIYAVKDRVSWGLAAVLLAALTLSHWPAT
ncbi:MAG: UbiA family prenyltransferase, partial [Xanthomonadales bacterium]|nr:UbiA family prenyltransferase [Xanthomonadales bacterium]